MSEQVRRKLKVAMQENARLKAENEKYRRCFQGERDWVLLEPGEHARLKAEVEMFKERLRDQVNLYGASQIAFKMYQDNVDSGGLHKDRKDAIARLEAENARLKAEVVKHIEEASNGRLKVAEVVKEAMDFKMHHKANVERLTKAGDAMMDWIDHQHDDSGYPHSEAWEAAKGVQS